ncbi:DUF5522 domain-containing protein [Streptomyces sp. NPDC058001]|uniref:DUF5522 domain-containing protein n=1 Tax=Streptomyces sp. NPDC058001 TaxID=3346300 RepID=UPI0036E11AC6
MFVLTAVFLERRGRCCGRGCRHCPYRAAPRRPRDQQLCGRRHLRRDGAPCDAGQPCDRPA